MQALFAFINKCIVNIRYWCFLLKLRIDLIMVVHIVHVHVYLEKNYLQLKQAARKSNTHCSWQLHVVVYILQKTITSKSHV